MKDPATGQMVRAGDQKIVAATFRHDTSRNLDPQLHTHAVVANMVRGEDDKWRSMANERLYGSKMLLGALYRSELAASLTRLGYDIEKTHADGRFEIAGVSRDTIEAFSTRRAEIEAAMAERGLGTSGDNPRLAERASLMTRGKKRDIDRGELRGVWERQAADLGLDVRAIGCRGGREIHRAGTGSGGRGGGTGNRAGQGPAKRRRRCSTISVRSNRAPVPLPRMRHHGWKGPATVTRRRRGARPWRKAPGDRPRRKPSPGRWRISRSARPCSRVQRFVRRRAGPRAGTGDDGRGRVRGGGAGEGRDPARREHRRRRGLARHREDGRRGTGNRRIHVRVGQGRGQGADAKLAWFRSTSTRGRSRPGKRTP